MRHPALMALSRGHHEVLILVMKCRRQALGQAKPEVQGLGGVVEEVSRFIARDLERHFQAEEKVLFPFLSARMTEACLLTSELRGEHDRIREGIDLGSKGGQLAKALFDFADLLERHIRREERELFPMFERWMTVVEAEEIQAKIDEILHL